MTIQRNNQRSLAIFTGIGIALLGIGAVLSTSVTRVQARPAAQVGPWDAMKAATAKVGGKAHSATYMSEGGKWLYDVIVIKDKKIMEVEVDAATGKAGDVEAATPESEGKEMVAELQKAIGGTTGKAVPETGKKTEKKEADEKD